MSIKSTTRHAAVDVVGPREEHLVAAHRVAKQPLIRRRDVDRVAAGVEIDFLPRHRVARPLGAGAQLDDHVGAEPEPDVVRRRPATSSNTGERRTFERDEDLGGRDSSILPARMYTGTPAHRQEST